MSIELPGLKIKLYLAVPLQMGLYYYCYKTYQQEK